MNILNLENSNCSIKEFLHLGWELNRFSAMNICFNLGINPNGPISALPSYKKELLIQLAISTKKQFMNELENFYKLPGADNLENVSAKEEGISKTKLFMNNRIQLLISLQSYRGRRHQAGLPVNGQRTRSNAKTAKRLAPFRSFKLRKHH